MKRVVVFAVAAAALTSCQHSGRQVAVAPPALVRGAFDAISVTAVAGHRSALIPPDLRKGVDPLLIARTVDHPGPISDYGLDAPVATLSYQLAPSAPVTVTIGGTNFDRTLVYVQRGGDGAIYAVLADAVTPVLALVGIKVPPPSG